MPLDNIYGIDISLIRLVAGTSQEVFDTFNVTQRAAVELAREMFDSIDDDGNAGVGTDVDVEVSAVVTA